RTDLGRSRLVVVLLQTHDDVLAESAPNTDQLIGRGRGRGSDLEHSQPVLDRPAGPVLIDDPTVASLSFVRQLQDLSKLSSLLRLKPAVQPFLVDDVDDFLLPV